MMVSRGVALLGRDASADVVDDGNKNDFGLIMAKANGDENIGR